MRLNYSLDAVTGTVATILRDGKAIRTLTVTETAQLESALCVAYDAEANGGQSYSVSEREILRRFAGGA